MGSQKDRMFRSWGVISRTIRAKAVWPWVCLLIVLAIFHGRIFGFLPIDPSDEAASITLASEPQIRLEYSWPYSVLYEGWKLLTGGDGLFAYGLNSAFLGIAIVLVVYGLLRSLRVARGWAFLGALYLAIWPPLVMMPVKVTHFNLLLQLVCAQAALWVCRRNSERFFLFGTCLFWLIYVRQDNLLLGFGALALGAGFLFFEHKQLGVPARRIGWMAALAAAALICVKIFSPFTDERTFEAFSDNFSWFHYEQEFNLNFFAETFSGAKTFWGVIQQNPQAFFAYGLANIGGIFSGLVESWLDLPSAWQWVPILMFLWLGAAAVAGPRRFWRRVRRAFGKEKNLFLLGAWLLLFGQAIVICFLLRSNLKYLVSLSVFSLAAFFAFFDPGPIFGRKRWPFAIPASAAILVAASFQFQGIYFHPIRFYTDRAVLLEDLEIVQRWIRGPEFEGKKIYSFGGYSAFDKKSYPITRFLKKPVAGYRSIGHYLDVNQIDYILVSEPAGLSANDNRRCVRDMGGVDGCKSFVASLKSCYGVRDRIGHSVLYERRKDCAEN